MKPTLLLATLSMVLASPTAFAKSELETLRLRCAEQERQIKQLENENSRLRSGDSEARPVIAAKTEPTATKPATAAKSATSTPVASTYTVKAGDNIEKIARQVGVNPSKLAKANDMTTDSIIHPGQKLKVPGMAGQVTPAVASAPATSLKSTSKTHKIQEGETFSSISKMHGISPESLAAANPKVKATALRPGQVVNLSNNSTSTTMITAPAARPKTQATEQKAPAPVAKAPEARQNTPVAKSSVAKSTVSENKPMPAAAKQSAAENEIPSPPVEKKIRPITIEGEMTYGEFASKYGTDAERLNALNGLDLTTATVLAKGSELYVPAQP